MSLDLVLRQDEKAVFALRSLYGKYGYAQYKMSKFEEYDLYVRNKDYLVSENVITFTDTDGKLMALKPDVTLSIIKNGKDTDGIQKVFYDENVYRVSKGTKSFKEIMQAGLECIGDVDDYAVSEVLTLAVKSLQTISSDFVLDVSSLDVIGEVLSQLCLEESQKKQIINFLSEKNAKGVKSVLDASGKSGDLCEIIIKLANEYGTPDKIKELFSCYNISEQIQVAVDKLCALVAELGDKFGKDKIRIDFSVVNSLNYYNGIVFKGFISGIPTGILSGGQYDNLMLKMGRKAKAIGFAVYLDELNKIACSEQYDVQVAVQYNNAPAEKIKVKVDELIGQGKSVIALKKVPEKLKYEQLINLGGEDD